MIKPREARRGGGATRCKQSSGHNHKLFSCLDGVGGGDFVLSAKSKKERLRKLSALGAASSSFQDCEMGCDLSDREDELPSKRFKLPKKFFDDCNGVAHASVPRKLRSAMKKRNRESASPSSPNSNKLNHTLTGIKSPERGGEIEAKPYLKHGGSDGSQQETVSGDITKDEEEVVETLYALAGLFPNNDPNDNSKVEAESLDGNPSAFPESESPAHVVEAGKDTFGSTFPVRPTDAFSPYSVERLATETDQVDSLNKPSTQHELELPNSMNFRINSDYSVPHTISTLSIRVQECNEKPIANDVNFCLPSDLNLDSRLNQPVQKDSSGFGRKPETALELGTTIRSHVELHDVDYEYKKNGPVLWPGLSSPVSPCARNESQSSSSQSPASKIPAWLNAAMSSSRAPVQNGSSFRKVTKVVNGRRSCKKCAAHVYISHVIQALQNSESKEKLQPGPNQTRSQEGSKPMDLLGVNIYPRVKNGLNGIASTAEKNPDEAKNGTLQQKKLHEDQPQSPMRSRAYTSPKRSFDFLALSAGGAGFEINDGFSRGRNGVEPSSQSQVPYIQSHMQHHTLIPFSLPQSHYSSSARPNNPSVAQQAQLQLPQYHGNPFCGPQASPTALTRQQPQQLHLQLQQQQQQRIWAAQMAAQYQQVGGTSTSALHFPSLQNVRQETTLIPCGQTVMSPSQSTLELVGPKFAPLSQQQQQQLMAVTSSFPPGRAKRQQDHHLPSMYEESGGGFRAGSALPLQLLCSERL